MRELTHVIYELKIIDAIGDEHTETFTHDFDSDLYNDDIDGFDNMMVNYKIQDLKTKYKDLFLVDFTIEREGNYCG